MYFISLSTYSLNFLLYMYTCKSLIQYHVILLILRESQWQKMFFCFVLFVLFFVGFFFGRGGGVINEIWICIFNAIGHSLSWFFFLLALLSDDLSNTHWVNSNESFPILKALILWFCGIKCIKSTFQNWLLSLHFCKTYSSCLVKETYHLVHTQRKQNHK